MVNPRLLALTQTLTEELQMKCPLYLTDKPYLHHMIKSVFTCFSPRKGDRVKIHGAESSALIVIMANSTLPARSEACQEIKRNLVKFEFLLLKAYFWYSMCMGVLPECYACALNECLVPAR